MTTAIIISAILFVLSGAVMVYATFLDLEEWIFDAAVLMIIVSFFVMVLLALYDRKQPSKEYPASEYTFKIKVVEFEEQRDTILVVIPKET